MVSRILITMRPSPWSVAVPEDWMQWTGDWTAFMGLHTILDACYQASCTLKEVTTRLYLSLLYQVVSKSVCSNFALMTHSLAGGPCLGARHGLPPAE